MRSPNLDRKVCDFSANVKRIALPMSFSAPTPITQYVVRKRLAEGSVGLSSTERICMIWASRALPYSLVDDPLFKMQFGTNIPPGLSRSNLKMEMLGFAQKVTEMIFKKVGSGPVCLGVDGWTNTRHRYFVPTPTPCLSTTFFPQENGECHHDTLQGSVFFG
jgi:hypothetical protein